MQNVIQHFGHTLIIAIIGVFTILMFTGVSLLKGDGTTANGPAMIAGAGIEEHLPESTAAPANDSSMDSILSAAPPSTATKLSSVKAHREYKASDIIGVTDGYFTVIEIMNQEKKTVTFDLSDPTNPSSVKVLHLKDESGGAVQYITFPRPGVYLIRYTAVGTNGSEKTRSVYINAVRK